MSKPIKFLVIHCTDTPAGRKVTGEDIRDWHLSPAPRGRGWKQVGYRGLIHIDGTYEKLIDYNIDGIIDPWEITNGVRGINGVAANICYAGGKGGDTRTLEQRATLKRYVLEFVKQQPNVLVAGHNQFDKGKACPSFNVPVWLKSIGVSEKNIYHG